MRINRRFKFMNTLEIKGTWNIALGRLKQKFAQLTDDDLKYAQGKEDELIGRIQRRTGQNKEEIKKLVNKVVSGCKDR